MAASAGTFTLHPIRLLNMSCFLYYREGEAMLVDCGSRGSEARILEEMEKLGLAPGDLDLLVLTHAHFDHAGAAAALKELTGCRILIHAAEADRLRTGRMPYPKGTRWKAKVLVGLGRVFRPGLMRYSGAEPNECPELNSGEILSLESHGFPLRLMSTPGHTPGSLIALTPGGELLSGDTLFGAGSYRFPPFAEDAASLRQSWQAIRALLDSETHIHRIYPAHGKPFPVRDFQDEVSSCK